MSLFRTNYNCTSTVIHFGDNFNQHQAVLDIFLPVVQVIEDYIHKCLEERINLYYITKMPGNFEITTAK